MKLTKSLLLASAAGLAAVATASAADLPSKKAAPVEYVKVCPSYGPGFYYIPGTDTCLRVFGNARFEANVSQTYARNDNTTSYRSGARIALDARNNTEYGLVRTVAQVDLMYRTGDSAGMGALRSGSVDRLGLSGAQNTGYGAYTGSGANGLGAQTYIDTSGYVQFGGFTAGRLQSAFTFAGPAGGQGLGYMGMIGGDSPFMQNQANYTIALGNGLTATVGIEDPTQRRMGIATTYNEASAAEITNGRAGVNLFGRGVGAGLGTVDTNVAADRTAAATAMTYGYVGGAAAGPFGGASTAAGVGYSNNTVNIGSLNQGWGYSSNRLPDVVANMTLTQGWGQVKLSGAYHEVRDASGALVSTAGFAGQLGVKIAADMISKGDAFYAQAVYTDGANSYAWNGLTSDQPGSGTATMGNNGAGYGNVKASLADAAVVARGLGTAASPYTYKLETSKSWGLAGAFDHYWAPTLHSWVAGSYTAISWGSGTRNTAQINALAAAGAAPAWGLSQTANTIANLDPASHLMLSFGTEWLPIKGLAIGSEVSWARLSLKDAAPGVTTSAQAGVGVTDYSASNPNAGAKKSEDIWGVRVRVKRDF